MTSVEKTMTVERNNVMVTVNIRTSMANIPPNNDIEDHAELAQGVVEVIETGFDDESERTTT